MIEKKTFNMLKGKTIKSIKQPTINAVQVVCEDGSKYTIEVEEMHYGVPVLVLTEAS